MDSDRYKQLNSEALQSAKDELKKVSALELAKLCIASGVEPATCIPADVDSVIRLLTMCAWRIRNHGQLESIIDQISPKPLSDAARRISEAQEPIKFHKALKLLGFIPSQIKGKSAGEVREDKFRRVYFAYRKEHTRIPMKGKRDLSQLIPASTDDELDVLYSNVIEAGFAKGELLHLLEWYKRWTKKDLKQIRSDAGKESGKARRSR